MSMGVIKTTIYHEQHTLVRETDGQAFRSNVRRQHRYDTNVLRAQDRQTLRVR